MEGSGDGRALRADECRSIADAISQHVVHFRYEALSDHALKAAKRLMLDTFAVAWAGSNAPGCKEVLDVMLAQGGAAEATVWAHRRRLPCAAAAFVNALAGAALDYDSINTVHADIVVLPVALALGERHHLDGREVLSAFVIGNDLTCRLGAAMTGQHKGWFNTSVYGVFGAAATAARLLHLNVAQTRNALGIALSQAAGTQQANVEQALTKRLQSAFAVQAGIMSALLAQKGITGPRYVFEGNFGLYRLYQDGEPERILAELGQRFYHENTNLKKYPVCACSHAAIEALMSLAQEYDLHPHDVTRVDAVISPLMHRLVGAPFEPRDNPQVAAQFSLQYGLACVLLRRRLGIDEIQDESILHPDIQPLVDRIYIHVDPESKGSRTPAVVSVQTKRLGLLKRRIDHFPWSDEMSIPDSEFQAKIRNCFCAGATPLDLPAQDRWIQSITTLEKAPDVAKLW